MVVKCCTALRGPFRCALTDSAVVVAAGSAIATSRLSHSDFTFYLFPSVYTSPRTTAAAL